MNLLLEINKDLLTCKFSNSFDFHQGNAEKSIGGNGIDWR